jgi:coronin-7
MAFKSQASKYRHVSGKVLKKELWYPDLRINTSASDVTMVEASTKFIAVNWSSPAATLGVLPLEQVGKRKGDPFVISAHAGQLADFKFSPFDDGLLATGAINDDAVVNLWKIPEGGLTENLSTPFASLSGHRRSVETFAFHPSAANVLASGSSDKTVTIWDIEQNKAGLTLSHFGDTVQSVAWNYDGSLLVSVAKDKRIRTLDPRANTVVSEGEAHVGQKAMRVVWLGNTPFALSTGFSKTRERQYALWDTRDLSKPVKLSSLDSSTGVIAPMYDVDTNLIFLGGNGDSAVRVLEFAQDSKGAPSLSELTVVAGEPQKGAALLPKRALDVMEVEVARVLRLTAQGIAPVSFTVPRKSKSKFADDLFPNTAGPVAALSSQEWFSGETKTPLLVSLDPESTGAGSSWSETASSSTDSVSSPAVTSPGVASPSYSSPAFSSPSTSSPRTSIYSPEANVTRTGIVPKIVRSSKYRHILSKPMQRTKCYDNLKVAGAVSNSIVRANVESFAVPWTGTGGPLAVIPLSQTGRLPTNVPCFEIGSQLLDFDAHPFNTRVFATGGEDAHVKIWRVPEGGLLAQKKNVTTPEADMIGHTRKITTVNFHPTADNILLTTGADLVVRVWDVTKSAEVLVLSGHNELIAGLAVGYQGDTVATACRDKQLRIFDMRSKTVTNETTAHTGAKGARVTWLGAKPQLLSVGFSKSSEREFKIWDTRSFDSPLTTITLDQLAGVITPFYDEDIGVVYLAGRGDASIKMYELVDEAPYAHYLNEYSSNVPQMGIAMLPKQINDVRAVEIARFIKVTDTTAEPIQMTVPRTRTEFFQDDVFTQTRALKATYSSDEWLSGATRDPPLESLRPEGMPLLSEAPAVEKKAPSFLSAKVVDDTPTRDQVMNKFYQQMGKFKEADDLVTNSAHDGELDDEWA